MHNNATVAELYGLRLLGGASTKSLIDPHLLVGPEIELESVSLPGNVMHSMRYWECVGDGSLRNKGLEVRARFPLEGAELINALIEYNRLFKGRPQPTFSSRTSTHLHINITNLTSYQVMNMWMNYLYFAEDILFNLGRIKFIRKKNPFCRTLQSAECLNDIKHAYENGAYCEALNMASNIGKYSSLHINTALGTAEFRGFGATTKSFLLLQWINTLADFVSASSNCPVTEAPRNKQEYLKRVQEIFPKTYNSIRPHVKYTKTEMEVEPINNHQSVSSDAKPLLEVHDKIMDIRMPKKPTGKKKPIKRRINPPMTSPFVPTGPV